MPENIQTINQMALKTIEKTMMTSLLFEGFWDRWIAHGIQHQAAVTYRNQIKSLDHWVSLIAENAEEYESLAKLVFAQGNLKDAERLHRIAGLHYNLIQWIYPETCCTKRMWFSKCKEQFTLADEITKDQIEETFLSVNGKDCYGRVRIPEEPKGCVIIINPIDSSKEELFTYEMDFAKLGFATVSFDGPGQGESYVIHGHKAERSGWELFINKLIDLAVVRFPELAIHLFGTSSGASWALNGGRHPKVSKVAAVSPALENDIKMPDYFKERLAYILEDSESSILPKLNYVEQSNPVILFHGNMDVMVKDEDIYALYGKLPQQKRLIEFEKEGHCCNFKLSEIRQISAQWFLEDYK
jgi:hypothetical protein